MPGGLWWAGRCPCGREALLLRRWRNGFLRGPWSKAISDVEGGRATAGSTPACQTPSCRAMSGFASTIRTTYELPRKATSFDRSSCGPFPARPRVARGPSTTVTFEYLSCIALLNGRSTVAARKAIRERRGLGTDQSLNNVRSGPGLVDNACWAPGTSRTMPGLARLLRGDRPQATIRIGASPDANTR